VSYLTLFAASLTDYLKAGRGLSRMLKLGFFKPVSIPPHISS